MYADRTDAGEQLAAALADRGIDADVVLAIPRGALPVARPVADRLGATLDVVVATKMGAPGNEELAIGAVAEDGTRWHNEDVIERLGVDEAYVERAAREAAEGAREKAASYRDGPLPDLLDRRVVVVDDGVATGATMRACLARVRADDPAHLVVAVPVGASETLATLERQVDDLVALEGPRAFRAVGAYYRNFDQVSDAEARAYLT
jgi:predicted phosphoribosyltransferase